MSEPTDARAEETDPTGIRELLAGLPDPGPMPEDLVRRIEARLEVEQAARSHGGAHPLGRGADRVVDLAAERSRRRPGSVLLALGGAAAALVAVAVVVPQLVGGESNDAGTAAHYPASSDSAGRESLVHDRDGAAESDGADSLSDGDDQEVADSAGEPAAPLAPLDAPLALDGELVLLPTLGALTEQNLTAELLLAVGDTDAGEAADAVAGGLTEGQAISCWSGLSAQHSFDRYAAGRAQLHRQDGDRQGEAVVALLGMDLDGVARSWVLPESCTVDPTVAPLLEGAPAS